VSRVAFHRPARFRPPALPTDKLALPAPPETKDSATAGTIFTTVLTVLSSVGVAGYMITYGRPILVVIGLLFAATAVSTVVASRLQNRQALRRASRRQRRRYRAHLAQARLRAREVAAAQRQVTAILHPGPAALWGIVTGADRIWERRSADPDFLHARVGTGRGELATPIEVASGLDPLVEYDWEALRAVHRLMSRMGQIDGQPSVIDVGACGVISIVGPAGPAAGLLRAILLQLVVLHAPDDLGLAIDMSDGGDWTWAKWLPHTFELEVGGEAGVRPLVTAGVEDLVDYLEAELAERMERLVARRVQLLDRDATVGLRHLVVVFTRFDPMSDWGRSALLRSLLDAAGPQFALTLIFLSPKEIAEPGRVDLRLRIDDDGHLQLDGRTGIVTRVDQCVPDRPWPSLGELVARRLSPLRLIDDQEQVLARTVSLTEMMLGRDPMEVDFAARWPGVPDDQVLRVPIGTDGDGLTVLLDLKESARGGYGPHGLIVGATGSGKSELLRTLVTALAIAHSPELLSFVLIDFKGGAAFAPLAELPHVAGLITNLADDHGMINRVHAALQGEQQRRQQLLRAAGNLDSIHAYQLLRAAGRTGPDGEPLPALPYLLIIVDEFGELLSDRPELADLFVQIGRVGRSLGMHLLMATQRLEEGKLRGLDSHLSYRICLRTFSAAESRVVIGTPDAYRLPPIPGSAYLKVDESLYQRLRVAHVSAPYVPADVRAAAAAVIGNPVVPFDIRRRPAAGEDEQSSGAELLPTGPTELAVVVDRIRMVGRPVHQVWLPPLPGAIPLDSLLGGLAAHPDRGWSARRWPDLGRLQVPIGVIDLPQQQEQQPLLMDFGGAHGHLAVVGAPRTGRSTVLRTVMLSAMLTHTPDEVQFYAVDFGGGTLHPFAVAPHVCGVAGRMDAELVRRVLAEVRLFIAEREALLRSLGVDSIAQFRERRAAGLLPAGTRAADVFLLIDNWGALRSEYVVDDDIAEIAARGLGVGVHLVLAANRWQEIRPALRDSIGTRLELRLNDPSDSEIARRLAAAIPSTAVGRGLTAPGVYLQVLLPRVDGQESDQGLRESLDDVLSKIAGGWAGQPAPRVRMLPVRLTVAELDRAPAASGVPIAIGEADLRPVALDLTQGDRHLMVFGDAGSGKTEFLRTWINGLLRSTPASATRFMMVDVRRSLLGAVPDEYLAAYVADSVSAAGYVDQLGQRLRERMPPPTITPRELAARSWWTGPELYVVVDDYDLIAGPGAGPLRPLVEFLPHAADIGLHLVVTRRVSGSSRGSMTDPLLARMRELGCLGLVLSGDPREGFLIGEERAAPRPPGRGMLVRRGQPGALVQVALIDDHDEHAVSAAPGR
jgi:S-DNA-T family DNA segregation ATPase FtsK/SpoIIIE